VAFVTGRDESARNATEVNLKAAGYGTKCRQQSQSKPFSDLGADNLVQSDSIPRTTVSDGFSGPGKACYVALHLREVGDVRLASVYKPERRAALEKDGYIVYGNFGDQFSDLDGTTSAPHSFKLPNPAYLIL
jgi:hypothetical protein